jgi:UDP-GlcNAc:undecaprenyl-phosphate/decaprenyl-phosphate GlcNAc-1-phosphate transferase
MLKLLLQIDIDFAQFKIGSLAFLTAFVVAMMVMPPLIKFIHRFKLFDHPELRKVHRTPVPTMGGIASGLGLLAASALWFQFSQDIFTISFFFSIAALMGLGIMDDLRNTPARYKFAMQVAIASLIAFSGVRIESFNGIFGIYALPLTAQYTFTVIAITGITNAFNLVDGIDGLAGGLGFMSLITLGLFLTLSGDSNNAIVGFALGGGLLGFLYYNFNPARIFMGDTGSLVLGFVVSVLCIKLIQLNNGRPLQVLGHAPIFALSIVAIPVFDTLRVFSLRIWRGQSPFDPDKNHVHHILTNNGWGHRFTTRLMCGVHALILLLGYFLKDVPQLLGFFILTLMMFLVVLFFSRLRPSQRKTVTSNTASRSIQY